METYYYIYKITNKVNGKLYIGVHKTNDLDDGYMGSGKALKGAIGKYGIENFEKKILEIFDNPDDMFQMESELVNEEFVSRKDTYNLKTGGSGGFDYINSNNLNGFSKKENAIRGRELANLALKDKYGDSWNVVISRKGGLATKKSVSDEERERRKRLLLHHAHLEKATQHRKETFVKIKHQQGKTNSQYGTCWITNGLESKKIKKVDIHLLQDGWRLGRT